uniref:Si:ch211-284k5.2 n=1 Tax=Cyprinodon variegatus TaxID=28743 RepID=A0A3Q2DID4_CYPVA
MHRSYQPFNPVTSRYLQQRWDQSHYDRHCKKVRCALPVVDTRRQPTPAHIQHKLKKMQMELERLFSIERDNHLLASRLFNIDCSKGLVDHRNQYQPRSLNGSKRKQELALISHQNQAIYQRIISCRSEYCHHGLLADWERTERILENISRYPKELVTKRVSPCNMLFHNDGCERRQEASDWSNLHPLYTMHISCLVPYQLVLFV